MSKKQKVNNHDDSIAEDIYVKTENPTIIYNKFKRNWEIRLRYRSSNNRKFKMKSTNGYRTRDEAYADSIYYRNVWENGTHQYWKTYFERGSRVLNDTEKELFTLKHKEASLANLNNKPLYIPMNAAKKSASKRLNKLCKLVNLSDQERIGLQSNLSQLNGIKWGDDYIKILRLVSAYYRSILSTKSELLEIKDGIGYIDHRIKSYEDERQTYIPAIHALKKAIDVDSFKFIIVSDALDCIEPISESDFTNKQLNRINLQCKLICKLLMFEVNKLEILIDRAKRAQIDIKSNELYAHNQYKKDNALLKCQHNTLDYIVDTLIPSWEEFFDTKIGVSASTIMK